MIICCNILTLNQSWEGYYSFSHPFFILIFHIKCSVTAAKILRNESSLLLHCSWGESYCRVLLQPTASASLCQTRRQPLKSAPLRKERMEKRVAHSPLNVGMGTSTWLDGDRGVVFFVFFPFLLLFFLPLTSSVRDGFNIRTVPRLENVWFCKGSCLIDWLGRSSHHPASSPSAVNVM